MLFMGVFIILHRLEKQNVFYRKILAIFLEIFSHRNEYQEYYLLGKGGRFIGLKTLPPSCADCLEIWEPQPPGTRRACPSL
jgi:hypothetical protein